MWVILSDSLNLRRQSVYLVLRYLLVAFECSIGFLGLELCLFEIVSQLDDLNIHLLELAGVLCSWNTELVFCAV